MKITTKYSPEFRERAVRMVFDHQGEHESQWKAIVSIATKIGCTGETLRKWVRQAERDQGKRPGLSSSERDRLKELELKNRGDFSWPPGDSGGSDHMHGRRRLWSRIQTWRTLSGLYLHEPAGQ